MAIQEMRGGNAVRLLRPSGPPDQCPQTGLALGNMDKASVTSGKDRNRYLPAKKPLPTATAPPSDRGNLDSTRNRAAAQSIPRSGTADAIRYPFNFNRSE